jgi:hypothetical protein
MNEDGGKEEDDLKEYLTGNLLIWKKHCRQGKKYSPRFCSRKEVFDFLLEGIRYLINI